jgi:hypothetical protein
MPDSIRELLQGIADDEPGPSRDLAAGAYKRARSIGRRRFATVAVSAVTSLAMASAATAAIVNGNRVEETPPADDPTVTESPTDPVTTTDEETVEETNGAVGCGAADDWNGWGASDSMGDLDSLPDTLVFEVRQDGASSNPALVQFDGTEPSTLIDDGVYQPAPDGSRFTVGGADACAGTIATFTGEKLDGLGIYTMYCKPAWSPDSDRVVLYDADPEKHAAYLLDVANGGVTEVPEEVGCSPKWSADGEFLVSADGSVAMRPDGSGRVDLAGAASWNEDPEFTGLSSISADLSRACLQFDEGEGSDSGHIDANRCDRYVDTETGDELEKPAEAQNPNIVFLADGSMIVCDDQYGQIVLTLLDADGAVADSRTLPGQSSGGTFLRGYFTG